MPVTINSGNSVNGNGIALTVAAPDSVTIEAGGFLISQNERAIYVSGAAGSYAFDIAGVVQNQTTSYSAMFVNLSNSTVSISVEALGILSGRIGALYLFGNNNQVELNNAGTIYTYASSYHTIDCDSGGLLTLNNTGSIFNQGMNNAIRNGGSANLELNNSGTIRNGGGALISCEGTGIDTISNSGTIGVAGKSSMILLGLGADKITNTGTGVIYSGVNMGDGADTYIGGLFSDQANGDLGADGISGNGGADFLRGGDGADKLTGGAGRDWLWGWDGGAANINDGDVDTFYYNALSDSGITGATRDVIRDFVRLSDKINLVNIDANDLVAGNQAFGFNAVRGAVLATGQLGYVFEDVAGTVNDKTIVSVNTDADAAIEFSIEMTGLKYLSATDFFL
jgi:Ca2+-binding RTX toxin-like protein